MIGAHRIGRAPLPARADLLDQHRDVRLGDCLPYVLGRHAPGGASPLDEVPGIGPGRKRALLMHFGTAKAVSNAAMDDLMAVEGISASVARLVYNHFHEN